VPMDLKVFNCDKVIMSKYSSEQLRNMVREDRVHRNMYIDPEVFEIEKEKIFKKVWLYVGHESLIPNPGDYYCTTLVGQPVRIEPECRQQRSRDLQSLWASRRQWF